MVKDSEDGFILDLDNIINEELRNLGQLMFMFESLLNEMGIRSVEVFENRKRYLKKFIESISSLSNKEELSLCHQLLDFVLEDILINKKTY